MPRKHRMYLPGIPSHIVQRGNNREPCFFSEDDYRFYLSSLSKGLKRYKVILHAYVLMTNHVHLLMTPTDKEGISRVMQLLGKLYVQYINKTYRRSGTLWEGRHKASLVNANEYFLKCQRYIELNPVAASMVSCPDEYLWSSYSAHAWGKDNTCITSHELYNNLGKLPDERQFAYRELFKYHLSVDDIHRIRKATHFCYPLGNERFKEKIEIMLDRKVGHALRGRPHSKKPVPHEAG
jgi:putative transposase